MRFALLGSGSQGNALVVEEGTKKILVDCGFSMRETGRRLNQLGSGLDELDAIVVTHEHNDHISGVGALARRYRIPVWMSAGSWSSAQHRLGKIPNLKLFSSHDAFSIEGVELQPFPVPHDAREPCQFSFTNGDKRLALVTDLGYVTDHIRQQLGAVDALVLECNHDPEMLANGPYPEVLKRRVAGNMGHLSNSQAAELLQQIDQGRLQHLIGAHLSLNNNCEERAREALSEALGCEPQWLAVASQDQVLAWRELL